MEKLKLVPCFSLREALAGSQKALSWPEYMIDVFRLTEAMKDLWGASGTEIQMEKNSFKQKNGQKVFQLIGSCTWNYLLLPVLYFLLIRTSATSLFFKT